MDGKNHKKLKVPKLKIKFVKKFKKSMTNNKDLRIEMIETLTNKNPKQAKSIISRTRRITQNTKSNNKKVEATVMGEEAVDRITVIELTAKETTKGRKHQIIDSKNLK